MPLPATRAATRLRTGGARRRAGEEGWREGWRGGWRGGRSCRQIFTPFGSVWQAPRREVAPAVRAGTCRAAEPAPARCARCVRAHVFPAGFAEALGKEEGGGRQDCKAAHTDPRRRRARAGRPLAKAVWGEAKAARLDSAARLAAARAGMPRSGRGTSEMRPLRVPSARSRRRRTGAIMPAPVIAPLRAMAQERERRIAHLAIQAKRFC